MKDRVEVAVIGSGASGLACACALAEAGRAVAIAEARPEAGGALRAFPVYLGERDQVEATLAQLRRRCGQAGLDIRPGHALCGLDGTPGRFRVSLGGPVLEAAAVVLATGVGLETVPADHGLAAGYNLMGLSALAALMSGKPAARVARLRGGNIALLLDGSARDSRRQQAAALSLAIHLRREMAAEVFYFCRDLKVAGSRLEQAYRDARDLGVTFFKDEGLPPRVEEDGRGYRIRAWVPSLGPEYRDQPLEMRADLLAVDEREHPTLTDPQLRFRLGLAAPRLPRGAADNCRLLHRTLRPGVFLAGSARDDCDLDGSLADGGAAAAAVEEYLLAGDGERRVEVDAARCARCLTCVRLCPHQAISVAFVEEADRAAATVDPRSCRACGLCASACPAVAIKLLSCDDEGIYRQLAGGRVDP